MRLLLLVGLTACNVPRWGRADPGAPVLLRFQQQAVDADDVELQLTLEAAVGDAVPVVIEAEDPEGDPWRVFVAGAPPGFVLDPDTGTGTWTVQEGTMPGNHATLWLHDVPRQGPAAWFSVPLWLVVPPIEK